MPRSTAGSQRSPLHCVLLIGMLALGSAVMHGQVDTSPGTNPGLPRPGLSRGDEDDPFRNNPGLRERMEKSRALDRQRRMVDDANRLVGLTAQYQKALEAHGTPTGDDQKLLAQIEKLARDVKDRMRGM